MNKYKLISKKGEGTFSEVVKAQNLTDNSFVAIKRMKSQFESVEQVNNLREIQALKRLSPHPCIVKLHEVLFDRPSGRLALVFEIMEMNIYELIRGRKQKLPDLKVKNYMWQLLKALDHMHRNNIFHRDIKPENMLVQDDVLKLADFGSCRGVKSKQPFTEYISTRWYRAPECLLTDGYYSYKMDVWGVACVIFEVVALFPLFAGTDEIDQVQKIHNIMGTPSAEVLSKFKRRSQMNFNFPPKKGRGLKSLLPGADTDLVDLLENMLKYDPDERFTARDCLKHAWFKEIRQRERQAQAERRKGQADEKSSEGRPSNPPAEPARRRRSDAAQKPVVPKQTHRSVRVVRQRPAQNGPRGYAGRHAGENGSVKEQPARRAGPGVRSLPGAQSDMRKSYEARAAEAAERRRANQPTARTGGKEEVDMGSLPAVYGSNQNAAAAPAPKANAGAQRSNSYGRLARANSIAGTQTHAVANSMSGLRIGENAPHAANYNSNPTSGTFGGSGRGAARLAGNPGLERRQTKPELVRSSLPSFG